jgi:hypothetical protein
MEKFMTVTHNIAPGTNEVRLIIPQTNANPPLSQQITKTLKDNSAKIAFIGSLLAFALQEPTAGPIMVSTASSVFEFAKSYLSEINLALSAFWGGKCTYDYFKEGKYTKAIGVLGTAAVSARLPYVLKGGVDYTKAFNAAITSLTPAANAAMNFFYPTV